MVNLIFIDIWPVWGNVLGNRKYGCYNSISALMSINILTDTLHADLFYDIVCSFFRI